MNNTKIIAIAVATFIVGAVLGFGYGNGAGYKRGDTDGYKRAEADIKKIQEAAGQKAAGEATKAANPFQGINPLAGVEANPFEKAKKILNPFQ